jgi:hypothetical protein
MDKLGIGRSNGCNGNRSNLFEENKQVLARTANFAFKSFEWHNKVEESGLNMCVNK